MVKKGLWIEKIEVLERDLVRGLTKMRVRGFLVEDGVITDEPFDTIMTFDFRKLPEMSIASSPLQDFKGSCGKDEKHIPVG